ncbi:MAG: M23 family metallopeptidase [Spongiibacteraceae bacterium]|jgi:murein DD-endopeptidase MepM/ murein hydrolase activator NlpD|nr:M23 family metallopeptidase [Spongiibacteraceae bacterium]
MKIVKVIERCRRSHDIAFGRWTRALLSFLVLGVPLGAGLAIGYGLADKKAGADDQVALRELEEQLGSASEELARVRRDAAYQLEVLAARTADLQARLMRLDSIGERMVSAANLDSAEFAFAAPGIGGPLVPVAEAEMSASDLATLLDELAQRVDAREQHFDLIQELMTVARVEQDLELSGLPVRSGYISSPFGTRHDPFHGKRALHQGIDFVAREGADVLAVAAGVVVRAQRQGAYGNLVEIEHSNGYVTRYAHNKKLLVKPGELVKKGQVVA